MSSVNNNGQPKVYGDTIQVRRTVAQRAGLLRRKVCYTDVMVSQQAPSAIRTLTNKELQSKKLDMGDGRKISYEDFLKEKGGSIYQDGEGRTIYVGKGSSGTFAKKVLDGNGEWKSINSFYDKKVFAEVNKNINTAEMEKFIEENKLEKGADGKYYKQDTSKDSGSYEFDLSGFNTKVKYNGGTYTTKDESGNEVKKEATACYMELGKDTEWHRDEEHGKTLREDLRKETGERITHDELLSQALVTEEEARIAGDNDSIDLILTEAHIRRREDETTLQEAKRHTDASVAQEATARQDGDAKLEREIDSAENRQNLGRAADRYAQEKVDQGQDQALASETRDRETGDAQVRREVEHAENRQNLGRAADRYAQERVDKKQDEDLASETRSREIGDEEANGRIDEEANLRAMGDTKLTGSIEEETAARQAGDAQTLTDSKGYTDETVKGAKDHTDKAVRTEADINQFVDELQGEQITRNTRIIEEQKQTIDDLQKENQALKAKQEKILEALKAAGIDVQ